MYFELIETKHRPFPMPKAPWMLTQVWNDMLFLHYQISPTLFRSYIPTEFEIDLFEGKAWISIVPFKITKMRARGLPYFPYFHTYLELNVRTYVKYKGVPGIYFFSLDADKLIPVLEAQIGLGLPYKKAYMSFHQESDQFSFQSLRKGGKQDYQLDVLYKRKTILYEPMPDSLDFWLLERYSMYSVLGNLIIRGDIHHDQWKVSMVHADIFNNTMLNFLKDEPFSQSPSHMHYSRRKRFLFSPPKVVGRIIQSKETY